jgi:Holliday junction resolvase-like predicted endonuclease
MVGFSRDSDFEKNVVKNTTDVGLRGEEAVSEYLERLGHKIVVRNFKTKLYEIDIISVFKDTIYFTEVKTRGSLDFGGGVAAVDKRKLDRMKFAVENFMKFRAKEFEYFSPILAVADVDGEFKVRDWFTIN